LETIRSGLYFLLKEVLSAYKRWFSGIMWCLGCVLRSD
jgi:hypothetical protein